MPSMPVEGGFTRSRRSAPPRSSTTRRHEELTEGRAALRKRPSILLHRGRCSWCGRGRCLADRVGRELPLLGRFPD
jgi:hypothetical protein